MAKSVVANRLIAAIMHLLPAVNEVVAAHRADDADPCRHCAVADPRDCPLLGLAAAALDLIIQCRRLTRHERDGRSARAAPRDLLAAVESKQLTGCEAAALTEILGVLDLAVAQAKDAGICLPTLAGIAVAVVDSYRAIISSMA